MSRVITFTLPSEDSEFVSTYLDCLNLEEADYSISEGFSEKLLRREHWTFVDGDCSVKAFDRNLYIFPLGDDGDSALLELAEKLFKDNVPSLKKEEIKVERRGTHYYPAHGFMGWHTNCDKPGWTLYITHVIQEGKSFFRYYDRESDTVRTSYDKEGFTCRIFKLEREPHHFKHCVFAGDGRVSLGFQITN